MSKKKSGSKKQVELGAPEKDEAKVRAAKARAESLTANERRAIALKAAAARWGGGRPLKATHKGSFREAFGIDVDCFVVDDETKSAVISQRGMAAAIGRSDGGSSLPRFLRGQIIAKYLGDELAEKFANPLVFEWIALGTTNPPAVVYGYDVTLLIDLCRAIVAANAAKKLRADQQGIVAQAHVILTASAKAGIKGLVYALAGYDQTKEEVIAAFKTYVAQEARTYETEFPGQLYREWYRLYQLPEPERNRPWKFKSLTLEQVYKPLARSNGKILELTRMQRAKSGERSKKLHQFLSDIGVKALRTHLGQLLGIAQVSVDRNEYEDSVARVFGAQLSLNF